jgi:hypothetical protein
VDATLFSARANLEATVYQKSVSDLILRRGLANSLGFNTQVFNGGSLRNRGVELLLNVVPVRSGTVEWNSRVNFTLNRCTVTSLPVPTFYSPNSIAFSAIQTEVGKSCTQIAGYDTLGRLPGDASLGPIGTRVVRPVDDIAPRFTTGWANDFTYKRLKLYFLWDLQKGGAVTNLTTLVYDFNGNSPDQIKARNPGEDGPRGLTGDQRAAFFSRESRSFVDDQSFLKLREVSLSLDLPQSVVRKLWKGARTVRLSAQGRNLVTVTRYLSMDPEFLQAATSLAAGYLYDLWQYPPSRSFWFSVDLGF